jgi:GTPase
MLPQIKGVPVVVLSAKNGQGVDKLIEAVLTAHEVWNRRIATAAINRFLAQAIAANPPPALRGRRLRLDYMTQPKSRPPTFVLFSSRPHALPEAYRRYLINGLRENFALPGTPIRLTMRAKANPYAGKKRRR